MEELKEADQRIKDEEAEAVKNAAVEQGAKAARAAQ